MKKELTYDMQYSEKAHGNEYQPLQFNNDFYIKEVPSIISQEILNLLSNNNYSKNKWRSLKTFSIQWKTNDNAINTNISFYKLTELLKSNRKYNNSIFNLPPLPLSWLDKTVEIGIPFYAPCNEEESSLTFSLDSSLGNVYPVKPKIDREGFASGSLQISLEKMLLSYRNELVNTSKEMFTPHDSYWLGKLMNFLNVSVSVVDITLTQLYYKAKYDSKLFNWKFDELKLGSTISRRITDKIKWIHSITGNHIEDISNELQTFTIIKKVRNHLNHFDPPVFAYTIEDVSTWLNSSYHIAMLLLKIRKSINSHISKILIEILLQPTVRFVPKDPGKPRYPQKNTGYKSCYESSENINGVKINWK